MPSLLFGPSPRAKIEWRGQPKQSLLKQGYSSISKYNIASKHFAPRVGMKRVKAAAAFSMHFVPLLSPFLLQLPSCSIHSSIVPYMLLLLVAQRKSHIWSNAFIQYIHKSQLYTMYMYLLLYMLYMHAWLLPSNQLSQTSEGSPPFPSIQSSSLLQFVYQTRIGYYGGASVAAYALRYSLCARNPFMELKGLKEL